jgi:alpha-glucosidase
VLNGEIGQYVSTARKDINSNDWYLGIITNENGRELSIDLSFLDTEKPYKATIYKDPSNGGWKSNPEEVTIETIVVKKDDTYTASLMPGGGQAIRFTPMK